MASSQSHPQHGNSLPAAISDAVIRITADYTGRGPTRARTTINGEWIFVTLIDTLTKGERTLANGGRTDVVLESRSAFQTAMRDAFVADVEGLTGRQVLAFLCQPHRTRRRHRGVPPRARRGRLTESPAVGHCR